MLQVDTHGGAESIMLGSTRAGEMLAGAAALPALVTAPFALVVGCELNGHSGGIGAHLLRRGGESTLGPFVKFVSLGVTGTEIGEAEWYRCPFRRLLDGDDLGHAVRSARRSVGH